MDLKGLLNIQSAKIKIKLPFFLRGLVIIVKGNTNGKMKMETWILKDFLIFNLTVVDMKSG